MNRTLSLLVALGLSASAFSTRLPAAAPIGLFARTNLVAWCIVPFDSKKRGPEERAAMLEKMQVTRLAYDYRAEHIPTFDAEVEALKRHHIELFAWWFPTELNAEAKGILDVLRRHGVKAQLWVTGGGGPTKTPEEYRARVVAEAKRIRPIALAAAEIGCTVALYNHGNWFGEPENQIAIIQELGLKNVGLVYNQHHGHDHLDRFPRLLEQMKPYLFALNLNGMTAGGDRKGRKIMPLAQGDLDLGLLKIIQQSGWSGPIGILNHTDEDAEARLLDNLEGLEWLAPQLQGKAPGDKPTPRSWREPQPSAAIPSTILPRVDSVAPSFDKPQAGLGSPPGEDPWGLEDPLERARLPEFQTIPAAVASALSPARGPSRLAEKTEWTRSLGDAASSRFSALSQITRDNVKRLEVAWTYHSRDGQGNIQCNPIMVDGLLFAPTVGHRIVALDAATGEERWGFRPELPKGGLRLEDFPARRGLLYWPGQGAHAARLIFTCGNWVYALDPKTGKLRAEFGGNGRAPVPAGGTVAGAVYQHVLVIPGFARDVYGFHIVTGERLWTFNTIPDQGEFGASSWSRIESGANCWGGMALDEDRGIAYVATGSPKPNFVGSGHHGDNLFSNCVLALDALTGKRLWHFQEIRHDIWDLDIPAPPNLVTVTHEGRRVDAVAQVTKLGNTLLLDRVSGEPLFPVRFRRAPISRLRGERTSPYQPDIELPEPFVRQVYRRDDLTTRSEEAREFIAKRVAGANCGWFEPFEEGKPTVLYGVHGGAEWTGAAFDPRSGFLYVSANELPWIITVFQDDPEPPRDSKHPTGGEKIYQQACASCHGPDRVGVGTAPPLRGLRHRLKDAEVAAVLKTGRNLMPPAPPMSEAELRALLDFLFLRDAARPARADRSARPAYTHNGYPKLLDQEGYPGCKPPWGTLNCIDLNTGRLRWKVPLGEYPELKAQGIPKTGTENFGGAMVTAGGLVFCGGTRDGMLRAFDSRSGDELWAQKLPWGGNATPATYQVNGKQYVVIAASGGGKLGGPTGDAWVAFALP